MNATYSMFKLNKKIVDKSAIFIFIAIFFFEFAFPHTSFFAQAENDAYIAFHGTLPLSEDVVFEVDRTMTITVTAYSSTVGQTDSTPCITANGFNLCKNNIENVIATNILPFGTKVRFPELGDTIYTVQDRMNARYTYRADIWKKSYADAKSFGLKRLEMEILK